MRFVQIGLVNTGKVAIDLSSVRVKHAVNLIMTNALVVFVYAIFGDVIVLAVVPNGQCGCEKCTTQDCINNCNDDVHLKFRDLMEENDTCKDYKFFISLSPEGKKEFLGDKYCDDGTAAADDIFKKMLTYVESNLETNTINLDELHLSCEDFNRSVYNGKDANVSAIGRKLKLCKNNGNKKGSQKKKKNKNRKSKK
jgi:hypothetical protein